MRSYSLSEQKFKYNDYVKIKDKNSKYAGKKGKIVKISSKSANVEFEGIKKSVLIMLNALEKI